MRMNKVVRESQNESTSRIEITYTTTDQVGEDTILGDDFPERVRTDLDKAQQALGEVA